MAKDDFPGNEAGINSPYHKWVVVTPSDTVHLVDGLPKAIHLGGALDAIEEAAITCVDKYGTEATFYLRQGDTLPIRPALIKSTGTTASAVIIALY